MSKGVIWASEYSLGPQLWVRVTPPGSATDKEVWGRMIFCASARWWKDSSALDSSKVILAIHILPTSLENTCSFCKKCPLPRNKWSIEDPLGSTKYPHCKQIPRRSDSATDSITSNNYYIPTILFIYPYDILIDLLLSVYLLINLQQRHSGNQSTWDTSNLVPKAHAAYYGLFWTVCLQLTWNYSTLSVKCDNCFQPWFWTYFFGNWRSLHVYVLCPLSIKFCMWQDRKCPTLDQRHLTPQICGQLSCTNNHSSGQLVWRRPFGCNSILSSLNLLCMTNKHDKWPFPVCWFGRCDLLLCFSQ